MKLYGIKNCDTVKKARKWLESNNIEYTFVDFKATAPHINDIETWHRTGTGAALINTRGTTFRNLNESDKLRLIEDTVDYALLAHQPTLMKRPVLVTQTAIEIGFNAERYEQLFNL